MDPKIIFVRVILPIEVGDEAFRLAVDLEKALTEAALVALNEASPSLTFKPEDISVVIDASDAHERLAVVSVGGNHALADEKATVLAAVKVVIMEGAYPQGVAGFTVAELTV